jgi:hypothetical protein
LKLLRVHAHHAFYHHLAGVDQRPVVQVRTLHFFNLKDKLKDNRPIHVHDRVLPAAMSQVRRVFSGAVIAVVKKFQPTFLSCGIFNEFCYFIIWYFSSFICATS